MVFLVLLLIPMVIAGASFALLKTITWKEFALQMGVQVVVAIISALIVNYHNMGDQETWNGRVTTKNREEVSCNHSYQCHCHESCSGSGKDRTCHEECDTCYEHTYDVDWNVNTSNGESMTIDRIDRQGLQQPPRWTSVKLGEPTAVTHSYTSYIKAAPDTLFRHSGQQKTSYVIPSYPGEVYDYYRLNRLVDVGVGVPNTMEWNEALSDVNADMGAAREANIVVVLTRQPRDYYYALEEAWIGGKKNDVILVIGVNEAMAPQWAEVMAWAIDPIFKVKLRDDVMDEKNIGVKNTMAAIRLNVFDYYKRKPMKDFEYLKASITPTFGEWLASLIVGVIVAIAAAVACHSFDVFDEERPKYAHWEPRVRRRW